MGRQHEYKLGCHVEQFERAGTTTSMPHRSACLSRRPLRAERWCPPPQASRAATARPEHLLATHALRFLHEHACCAAVGYTRHNAWQSDREPFPGNTWRHSSAHTIHMPLTCPGTAPSRQLVMIVRAQRQHGLDLNNLYMSCTREADVNVFLER